MKIPFLKMSGAGNDFVLVDGTPGAIAADWKPVVRAMCDRRRGIGADGVLLLSPSTGEDFTMDYFNADGSTGSLCGNGGRCAASYMMEILGRDSVSFRSCGRRYTAVKSGNGVILDMDDPGPPRMNIRLCVGSLDLVGHFIDTGSPHLVLLADTEPDTEDVVRIGREIRHHQAFAPSGTNVDFVTVGGEGHLGIRTYERGVEAETWACGTGSVAAALVYSILRGKQGAASVTVIPLSGEPLIVRFTRTGSSFANVKLEGPATVTFRGVFDTDRRY
jgi:diaminopimelate epimerase